ncbi:MAG: PAS domain S-box protein, partial [Opitutaceae bacterium]
MTASSHEPAPPARNIREAMATWMQQIAPYGIFTTDQNLRITTWNEWLVERSGLAASTMLGQTLQEVYPELEERHLAQYF